MLEPLRGAAALAVAWFHFTGGGTLVPEGTWLHRSGTYGWLGVEVFFVISGFIIPYSMHRSGYRFPADAGRFVLKRVVRLDPPYLVTVVLVVVLLVASSHTPGFQGDPPDLSLPRVLAHLGYLNAFLGYRWLTPVFWTLAIEFQFYLLVAVLFSLLAHRRAGLRLLALALLAGSAYVVTGPIYVFHYGGLFALGAATFHKRSGLLSGPAYLTTVAALATVTWITTEPAVAGIGLATALVIAYVHVRPQPVLTWLGRMSYSLYLLHVPIGGRVVNLGAHVATTVPAQLGVIALALATSLGAAFVLYRFVERPAQRWSSSIRYAGAPRSPAPIDVASPPL